jgi:hypothetical protein
MANPMKGEAKLGEFTLAFNFGAFCALEEKTGQKMPVLVQMMQEGLGFCELRDFAWAGLLEHNPGIKDEDVKRLIDEVGFEAASGAIGKAVAAFFSSQKEKVKNPPKAA